MLKRIVVMCSGGGSNFQTLIDGCNNGAINGRIVRMISSAKKAYSIERARANGIEALAIHKNDYPDTAALDRARHEAIMQAEPDLVVLAGFLGIVPLETVRALEGKILNIHPALIPSFCGKGMYGQRVHQAVLEYGAKVSGATVHFVNEEIDGGPVVFQKCVPVLEGDTVESLADRVLEVEHELLPKAVELFCRDELQINGRIVSQKLPG